MDRLALLIQLMEVGTGIVANSNKGLAVEDAAVTAKMGKEARKTMATLQKRLKELLAVGDPGT